MLVHLNNGVASENMVDTDILSVYCIFFLMFYCPEENTHIEQSQTRLNLLHSWVPIQICLHRPVVCKMVVACPQQRIHTSSYIWLLVAPNSPQMMSALECSPAQEAPVPPTVPSHIKLTLFQDHSCWPWALSLRLQRILFFVSTLSPELMSCCHKRRETSREDSCALPFAS